ncbi:MAG: MopE-related protein [Myxococcota bacterium]
MRTVLALVLSVACTGNGGSGDDTAPALDDSGETDTQTDPTDLDGDGYGRSEDCDDTRASVNPGVAADVCNGLDDDCDGRLDEDVDLRWFADNDGDGFGESGGGSYEDCDPSEGFVPNDADCDDDDDTVFPGAADVCDRVDNDCDGETDEDPETWLPWHADLDGDGAGDPDGFVYGCFVPADGADNDLDCDDADPLEPVFVAVGGSTGAEGTYDDPVRDVMDGMLYARDCVVVMPGTYDEDLDFGGENIVVRSAEGPAETILRGTGSGPVVTFSTRETSSAVLEGFTITGGSGVQSSGSSYYWDGYQYVYYDAYYWYGGGVYVSGASPTLRDLVISDNTLPDYYYGATSSTSYLYMESYGGGVYAESASLTLEDVHVRDNNASWGGGLYLSSTDISGVRVEVAGNTGQWPTIAQFDGTVELDAFVINAESSDYSMGGWYASYGDVRLWNGVLASSDYGFYNYASTVGMSSVIVAGNTYGLHDGDTSQSTWTLTYNDVYGNRYDYSGLSSVNGQDGNMGISPSFVLWYDDTDATNDDFHLSSTGPARRRGRSRPVAERPRRVGERSWGVRRPPGFVVNEHRR